jgi:hypothetical protein
LYEFEKKLQISNIRVTVVFTRACPIFLDICCIGDAVCINRFSVARNEHLMCCYWSTASNDISSAECPKCQASRQFILETWDFNDVILWRVGLHMLDDLVKDFMYWVAQIETAAGIAEHQITLMTYFQARPPATG